MNIMKPNWNNIFIGTLVIFLVYIIYKLAFDSQNSDHRHLDFSSHTDEKHFIPTQNTELSPRKAWSDELTEKNLRLKLVKAEDKIKELKILLMKERKKTDKRQVSRSLKFHGQKLVHLDLKGAPPKMPYLIKLLSRFRRWGATGVLVEYEDMFPYSGELALLKAKYAYSKEEITVFLKECKKQNLMVVPLIQTFGHLEFVLKHKKFSDLRETYFATNSICPNKKGSVPLIKTIIDQVLALHPEINYFHVGGDEVYNLKTCPICLADKRSKIRLFIDHMTAILKHVKSKKIIPLMWDDMMRTAEVQEMKELGSLMEPMVWGYGSILQNHFPPGMWDRFAQVFPKLWAASAFKGATKPNSNYVPIKFHVKNNLEWLETIHSLPRTTHVEGIALTGWSRFDHYASLCELLPAGLPSLAFCLKALSNGQMNESSEKEVIESLGLPQNFSLDVTPYKKKYKDVEAAFPGNKVFTLVGNLTTALYALNGIKHLKSGWISQRHITNKFLSYQHIHRALNYSDFAYNHLMSLKEEFLEPLNKIYNEDTVNEWLMDKISSNLQYAKRKYYELFDIEKSLVKNVHNKNNVQ